MEEENQEPVEQEERLDMKALTSGSNKVNAAVQRKRRRLLFLVALAALYLHR